VLKPRRRRMKYEVWLASWVFALWSAGCFGGVEFICICIGIINGEPAIEDFAFVAPADGSTVVGPITIEVELDIAGDIEGEWTADFAISDADGFGAEAEIARMSVTEGGRYSVTWTPTGGGRVINLFGVGAVYGSDESNSRDDHVSFTWSP
jgi:hypothetical protein